MCPSLFKSLFSRRDNGGLLLALFTWRFSQLVCWLLQCSCDCSSFIVKDKILYYVLPVLLVVDIPCTLVWKRVRQTDEYHLSTKERVVLTEIRSELVFYLTATRQWRLRFTKFSLITEKMWGCEVEVCAALDMTWAIMLAHWREFERYGISYILVWSPGHALLMHVYFCVVLVFCTIRQQPKRHVFVCANHWFWE